MKKNRKYFQHISRLVIATFALSAFQCGDPGHFLEPVQNTLETSLEKNDLVNSRAAALAQCPGCKFVIPAEATNIDGEQLGIRPGDVICLSTGINYRPLRFANLHGDSLHPITITNCGGKVFMNEGSNNPYVIKVVSSRYLHITGGDSGYGISLSGANLGLSMDHLTTNFEIDHIEVAYVGFAGIIAKTDPTCDDATIRGHFTMKNISIHDNFVHYTGGEGLYIGNSFYENGIETPCGVRKPHAVEGAKVYNNLIQFTGRDGIQLGSATHGADVFNNNVEYFGTNNEYAQNSGIQIGEGTGGRCFNNLIRNGSGNGVTILGLGGNLVQGNVIISSGASGIFSDDRYTPGPSFSFKDNVILNPKGDGIRLYSEKIPMNYVVHNLIVNPGNYWKYLQDQNNQGDDEGEDEQGENSLLSAARYSSNDEANPVPADAYIFRRNKHVKLTQSRNIFTNKISSVRTVYNAAFGLDAINKSPAHQPVPITNLLNASF